MCFPSFQRIFGEALENGGGGGSDAHSHQNAQIFCRFAGVASRLPSAQIRNGSRGVFSFFLLFSLSQAAVIQL